VKRSALQITNKEASKGSQKKRMKEIVRITAKQ
jgi:hypothetical protein